MSKLPDEQWDMIEDSISKKRTAQSARHRRTHCGKGGSIKFPSDYMTKKELKAMNGEVKSYRLNDPMMWEEFKQLPDDIKTMYIKGIREKYDIPDKYLAEAMGVASPTFCRWMKCLGCTLGVRTGLKGDAWKESEQGIAFYKWWRKEKIAENTPKIDDIKEANAETGNMYTLSAIPDNMYATSTISPDLSQYVMPKSGSLYFECSADDAINVIHEILQNNKVSLSIQWTLMED